MVCRVMVHDRGGEAKLAIGWARPLAAGELLDRAALQQRLTRAARSQKLVGAFTSDELRLGAVVVGMALWFDRRCQMRTG
jgi:hypothetical protein